MYIRIKDDDWNPAVRARFDYCATESLTPSHKVIWERAPYRVVEVKERPHVNWSERFVTRWREAGMPTVETWRGRPWAIVLQDDRDPRAKRLHLEGPGDYLWYTLDDHYAVCHQCGEIPPCREVHLEEVAKRVQRRFEKVMSIMPGCCHACGEPITKRQKNITFPGPNLIRPDLGDDSALFHLRDSCVDGARHYDKDWAKATGSRPLLHCSGMLTIHYDDKGMECTELAECVGPKAQHQARIWHYPYRGAVHGGCWCLVGAPENLRSSP